jgi:hypothetical protein
MCVEQRSCVHDNCSCLTPPRTTPTRPCPRARPQLLSDLLLSQHNLRLMLRYVSDPQNLMQMMNLLKDSSRSIQFEAFHVFKARAGLGVRVEGLLRLAPPPWGSPCGTHAAGLSSAVSGLAAHARGAATAAAAAAAAVASTHTPCCTHTHTHTHTRTMPPPGVCGQPQQAAAHY